MNAGYRRSDKHELQSVGFSTLCTITSPTSVRIEFLRSKLRAVHGTLDASNEYPTYMVE